MDIYKYEITREHKTSGEVIRFNIFSTTPPEEMDIPETENYRSRVRLILDEITKKK